MYILNDKTCSWINDLSFRSNINFGGIINGFLQSLEKIRAGKGTLDDIAIISITYFLIRILF